ncbi:hypothetical protein BSNK01_12850 [Bacillaceae bacterium]
MECQVLTFVLSQNSMYIFILLFDFYLFQTFLRDLNLRILYAPKESFYSLATSSLEAVEVDLLIELIFYTFEICY